MIYIKDYRFINSQIFLEKSDELKLYLSTLIGKIITVYTDSGGKSGSGVDGFLLKVCDEYIELLLDISSQQHELNCQNSRKCDSCRKRCNRDPVETKMNIYINHIIAFTYNYV